VAERLEVRIDEATCEGALACVRRLPAAFLIDDHESTAVAVSPQPVELRAVLEEVAAACPTGSISVTVADVA
jgi:ferredoxin